MTLNEIFDQINGQVATVNGIVYSLTDPYMHEINRWLNAVYSFSATIEEGIVNSHWVVDREQYEILKYLILSYGNLVDEYEYTISSLRSAMERSFAEYYSSITYKMESAIQETWNTIDGALAGVDDKIELVKTDLESQIAFEIDASESWFEGLVSTLEDWTGVELNTLADTITDTAGEIYGYIAEESAAIYNTISDWVDELWDYVGAFIDWVQDEFSAYYIAVRQWILDKATEIYAVIETKANELIGFINDEVSRVWQRVLKVQSDIEGMLTALETTLRAWMSQAIDQIESLLTDLSMLTDWRFQFLNIFMSKPELSILQVLNRDDTTFEQYKPYWQALFTRIMAT